MNINAGALNLFAALTRAQAKSGDRHMSATREFIRFFEYLDREIPAYIIKVHVVLDNKMHKGKRYKYG